MNSAVLVGSKICAEAARSDRLLACVRYCGNSFMQSEYQPRKHGRAYSFEGPPKEAPASCDSEFRGLGWLHDLRDCFGHCLDLMKPSDPFWLPDRRLCHHGSRSHFMPNGLEEQRPEAARSDRLLACVRHGRTAFMHSECQPCKHGSSVVSTATLTSIARHREHVIQSSGRWGGLGGSTTFETALATAQIKVMKPNARLWPPDNRLCHHGTSSHTCLGCFSVSVHSELCFQRHISFWPACVGPLQVPHFDSEKVCEACCTCCLCCV